MRCASLLLHYSPAQYPADVDLGERETKLLCEGRSSLHSLSSVRAAGGVGGGVSRGAGQGGVVLSLHSKPWEARLLFLRAPKHGVPDQILGPERLGINS